MRVLFLTPYLVYRPDSGSAIRRIGILQCLSRQHNVTLVGQYSRPSQAQHLELSRSLSTALYPFYHPVSEMPRDMPSTWPSLAKQCFNPELRNTVTSLLTREHFDLIHVEHCYFAVNLPKKIGPIPVHLDEHNIESEILRRQLSLGDARGPELEQETLKMYQFEARTWTTYPRCIFCSEREETLVRTRMLELRTAVVPNCIDTDYFHMQLPKHTNRIAYVGSFNHPPNLDGLRFLIGSILPELRRIEPKCELLVIGGPIPENDWPATNTPNLLLRLSSSGMYHDVRRELDGVSVMIVPIRFGSGTRLKILTAMAMGVPVVTTRIGGEGLQLIDRETCMFAETAAEFASRVGELLDDNDLWWRVRTNARSLVESVYSYHILDSYLAKAMYSISPELITHKETQ